MVVMAVNLYRDPGEITNLILALTGLIVALTALIKALQAHGKSHEVERRLNGKPPNKPLA